ncbi:putative mitochondrial protein, partial [Mucuna pruriens]
MKEEMEALEKKSTWEIVDKPKEIKELWIYIVKCKSNETLDRYKTRLVTKGYTQTYGIDYEETFAPIVKMNTLKYFLGVEVAYPKQGIFISQKKYVLDLLKEIGKLGCQTSRVSIKQNHSIECEESPTIEKSQYQRLVGKLIYLSHTRSDIAYVVSVVSQFMHDHKERHLQAVERIL